MAGSKAERAIKKGPSRRRGRSETQRRQVLEEVSAEVPSQVIHPVGIEGLQEAGRRLLAIYNAGRPDHYTPGHFE